MDSLFTPEEVSEKLKLRTETVYRYIREGKLPAARFGRKYRVTPQALEQFIQASTAVTQPVLNDPHHSGPIQIIKAEPTKRNKK